MKKWIILVFGIILLTGILKAPVFAGQSSSVTATIDSNKLVTVSGIINSGAGKAVNIKIVDPNGLLEYADSIVSYAFGGFQVSYTMTNNTTGEYKVFVNALAGDSSAATSFTYGTDNALKALSISRGGFDKAFSPEIRQYAVSVDERVDRITVTPTVNDATASVSVNGRNTASGMPSGQVLLNEGENTVSVAVTALSGQTNTYTITVTRESGLSASLTAEASIDAAKNVTISGTISSDAGQLVTLKIMDPSGSLEYVGSTVSTAGGKFEFTYKLSNTVNGRYTAELGALGVSAPVTASFEYFELKSLAISGITLKKNFQSDITAYIATAEKDINSITVTPTASDSNADITVNSVKVASGKVSGPITLSTGANAVTVVLSGKDGETSRTYTIMIAKNMEIVEGGTVKAKIDDDGLVRVNGTIGWNEGRQVTILIRNPNGDVDYLSSTETTAEGAYQFSYTLTDGIKGDYEVFVGARGVLLPLTTVFQYNSNKPELSGLELSAGTLSPGFAADNTGYSANVSYATGMITVRPYTVDPLATIKVNGSIVKSGEASGSIYLNEGSNTIQVIVTAPDEQEITYTVNVTRDFRPLSGNADLSALSLSTGSLSPAFNVNVTSYTVNVVNSVFEITVTPVTADSTAAVTVNGNVVNSGSASGKINLVVGSNTVLVKVTAQNGTVKTYTLTVTREKPSNADLSGLTVSVGALSPDFSPNVTSYAMNVANNVSGITVTPVTADALATVTVNGNAVTGGSASGNINLVVGSNTVLVKVAAQNGTVKTYTLTVTREKSSNADLSGLTVSAGSLSPAFNADITSYSLNVTNNVSGITITPTTADATATVTVNGKAVTSGRTSDKVDIGVGNNTVLVNVTAQNGNVKTYTLTVIREKSSNAYLSGLTVSTGTLSPAFSLDIASYTMNVANSVSEMTVTPVTADTAAAVTVNGNAVTSGSASGKISLAAGINTVLVKVTAANGNERTYTLIVTRAKSSNANLSALSLSTGTLSPGFAAATTSYTANVANSVSSIQVSTATADAGATVTVNGSGVSGSGTSGSIGLNVGSNAINVVVKAQDGVTLKTYTITVTRAPSDNADLRGIILSSGSINGFDPDIMDYTVTVPNDVIAIRVTPFADEAFATLKVNGTDVLSGGTTAPIGLSAGSNTISIVATAQNRINTKTYTITVKRAYDVNLNAMYISNNLIAMSPSFTKDTVSYTASVAYNISSITVTPHAAEATSVIKVNNTVVSSGSASGVINLNPGVNTVTVTVTAPDNTSKTYTIMVTRISTDIADLSDLAISGGSFSPVFSAANTFYQVTVSSHTETMTVTPTVAIPGATVTVNNGPASQPVSLGFGLTDILVKVTAQNGTTTKTYTIRVTRPQSQDNTLSTLTVSSGSLSPLFSPSVTNYTVEVDNSVSSITVTPTTNDSYASVTVNGNIVTGGSASAPISLTAGSSTVINIVVTPQALGQYKYYTVTVNRAPSDNADLSALSISTGSLNFSSGTTAYAVSVDYDTTKLRVTPTVADAGAKVKVNGMTVTSGSSSGDITLGIGQNTINVEVTAQDNKVVKTYVLKVTRIASENADLSGITLSTGSLNETFAANVTEYTMSVANDVNSLTVTPVLADSTAVVSVSGGASLAVGANTITITVTAQDEKTVKTYQLTVTRAKSSNANLSSLAVGGQSIDLSAVPPYRINVANEINTVAVTPTLDDSTAAVAVSGGTSLVVGPNTVTVTVTAQDGVTVKTYTVTVNRAKSSNADLSSLVVGGQSVSLSVGTTSYSVSVANEAETITVTPTAADSTARKIEVNGMEVASGSPSGSISLIVGMNTITVTVTAQDDTAKEYTITVTRTKSGNANLSSLIVGGESVSLSAGITNYSVNVANGTDTVTVKPTAADAAARKIEVNGTEVASGSASESISLITGNNTITVKVTAQDDTTKEYTIIVTRAKSSNANLSGLLLKNGEMALALNSAFDSGTLGYTLSVENEVSSITVTPTSADSTATIKVKGTAVASGSASGSIGLMAGDNEIAVEVTAENGTRKTYTITATRAPSGNADLGSLSVTGWTLSPAFDKDTQTYTLAISNSAESIEVLAETSESNAVIVIDDGMLQFRETRAYIDLTGKDTAEITITVTAQDGKTQRTYTINVSRSSALSDASLSNLRLEFYYHDEVTAEYQYKAGGPWLLVPTGTAGNGFTPEHDLYECYVNDVNSWEYLTVMPTAASEDIRSIEVAFLGVENIEISSGEIASGSATGYIRTDELKTVKVEVTAYDGTKAVYTVTVIGKNNASLSGLIVSEGSLSPAFSASELYYAVDVTSNTESITVTPATFDLNAAVTVNGIEVARGSTSQVISLDTGENMIFVVVTARDGLTTKDYVLTVVRAASEDAGLNETFE